ncbi:MAG TPA: DNA polymerase I [Gammaproteobacteria bacterium]|nr:DNA polymerase I [Gammaproteobacteria bacterium]
MAEKHDKPVILVDGSSYLYRAYHIPQLQQLRNARGEPTGAVYGVLNMLRKLRNDYAPEYMVVVFDAKGKTFRHDLYEAYKANRSVMPEELQKQIGPLHAIVRAMGLPLLSIEGVEADDIIGTLARHVQQQGWSVLISTGDKDMAQLVNPRVKLVNTMTNTLLDEAAVLDKFGVNPGQIIDYLALMGDSSDNIPGVDKVGPKTAAKWLQEYGTLEQVLAHAADIKGKIGENLRAAAPQLPLSKRLTTIDCGVDLRFEPDELRIGSGNATELRDWFTRFEFKSWLSDLEQGVTAEAAPSTQEKTSLELKYETVSSKERFETWLERLRESTLFAFDTETTSLDYMQAELVGVSFAVTAGEAAYVPVGHRYPGVPDQLPCEYVLEQLKPLLEDRVKRRVVGQHIKYDRNVLRKYGILLDSIAHDTMLQSYVLNSTATRHDLDSLAKRYLDIDTLKYEDVTGRGAKQLCFDQVDIELATRYSAEDADLALRLHNVLRPKLDEIPSVSGVYSEIELPLIGVLSRMECNGVRVDADRLRQLSGQFARQMLELEAQAHREAGGPFNLGSPKQIQEILFEQQGLPVIRKTPKGQPSTAEDVLQELADLGHRLPALIVQHRGLSKLKSTYTDKLTELIDPKTGRVHTSYHQAVASTGRLSSSDPNLQNIPIRTQDGREIRKAFVASPGKQLIAADYSQIELRIMAHLSGDKGLLQAFERGEDIHRATAAEVFRVARDSVTTEQRRAAKAINFGLIYGMSAFGLGKQLGIGRNQAQAYVDLYFERYPGVKNYMDATRQLAHERGYVETVFGRRLYLPEIQSRNAQERQYAERTAINAPMQGTAADIIKRAMIDLDHWLQQEHADVLITMQVHDELVFEAPADKVKLLCEHIRDRMRKAAELSVPLDVDIGTGENWDEAH